MKKEKAKPDGKKDIPPVKQPPAESAKPVSESKKKEKKLKASDTTPLPVLVEFAYTTSAIVVILVTLTVVIISILTGASLLDLVVRTGVTTLGLGGLFLLISWQISVGVLKASQAELKDKQVEPEEKQESPGSSGSQAMVLKNDSAVEAQ